jgi:hypothetical protein
VWRSAEIDWRVADSAWNSFGECMRSYVSGFATESKSAARHLRPSEQFFC